MSNETEDAAARRSNDNSAPGVAAAPPPAGWYPSPAPSTAPGVEMYWDGVQWHAGMVRGHGAAAAAATTANDAAPDGMPLQHRRLRRSRPGISGRASSFRWASWPD